MRVESEMTRGQARRLRDGLTAETRFALSERIRHHLLIWPVFESARSVMAYVSTGSEVDTAKLLDEVLSAGKRLFLPRCHDHGVMETAEISDLSRLVPGRFLIPEPAPSLKAAQKQEIDLILVPGLFFDAAGVRLGRGGGYYDRFLRDYRGITCGLAFSIQIAGLTPKAHDVNVQALATEHGIIRCGEDIR